MFCLTVNWCPFKKLKLQRKTNKMERMETQSYQACQSTHKLIKCANSHSWESAALEIFKEQSIGVPLKS
jgi:hypothetical protein